MPARLQEPADFILLSKTYSPRQMKREGLKQNDVFSQHLTLKIFSFYQRCFHALYNMNSKVTDFNHKASLICFMFSVVKIAFLANVKYVRNKTL